MPHGIDDDVWRAARAEIRDVLGERARTRSTITYRDLVASIRAISLQAGDKRLFALLADISIEEAQGGRGMLSAVVVSATDGMPGPGFFRLAERLGRDVSEPVTAWVTELRRVHDAWRGDRPAGSGDRLAATLVSTVAQVRVSLASWIAGMSSDPKAATAVLRTTRSWVHDPDTRAFGPARFVGFVGMTIAAYPTQGASGTADDPSDGRRTRGAIERILGQRFCADAALGDALQRWGARALSPDVFKGVPRDKWRFVTIGA